MAALGELLLVIVYTILSIPFLILLVQFIRKRKQKNKKKRLLWMLISLAPLILYGYWQYSGHRQLELENVGKYKLTNYPNCDSCILELKPDNHYYIFDKEKIIEKGKWGYRSGGDYWIVDIGENGQLGAGNYNYQFKGK